MSVYLSQFIAAALLLVFLGIGAITAYLVVISEVCLDMHKFASVVFTLICGVAIMIFRVLRGVRTRWVKYLHLLIHLGGIAVFFVGLYPALGGFIEWNPAHKLPSYIALGCIGVQLLFGFFLFTYLYENQRWRLYYAPLHDIFGIWIFICLVGCCIAGNWNVYNYDFDRHDQYYTLAVYCGCIIVIVVVLAPFFEWDLVGYL